MTDGPLSAAARRLRRPPGRPRLQVLGTLGLAIQRTVEQMTGKRGH